MVEILICTHDPMLIKEFCNPFRDAGYSVTTVDHAAKAIQLMLKRQFAAVLLDSGVMGMSPAEALPVIRRVSPGTRVVVLGDTRLEQDMWTVPRTADFEEVRKILPEAKERALNTTAKERV